MGEDIDIQNVCRTCLTTGEQMFNIFVEDIVNKLPSYKNMLMFFSNLKINKNDKLPQQICAKCTKKIESIFKYIQEAERLDKLLRTKLFQKKVNVDCCSKSITDINQNTGLSTFQRKIQETKIILNDSSIQINKINIYFCHKCDHFFLMADDLDSHKKYCNIDATIKCRFCSEIFKEYCQLLSHVFTKHVKEISLICGYCNVKCLNENLENHIIENHNNILNSIPAENYKKLKVRKDSVDYLVVHNIEDILKTEIVITHDAKPHCCPVANCDKTFETEEDLLKHLTINHHKTGKAECYICQKVFKHKKNLKQHLITHMAVKRYICKFCLKGFNYAHHLQNHEKIHTKEAPYLCNECGKRFKVKYNLKVHMRRHSNEKPYSCHQCNKTFAHRSALSTHTRTHSGERPYMCSHCGKTFTTKGNLSIHTEKIHNALKDCGIGSYEHVCRFCNKNFENALLLMDHMKKHTRQYTCEICKQSFSLSSALENHVRTHSVGNRSHICSDCGAGFNRLEHLRSHILRKHTDVKPYKCLFCQKTFAQSGDLNAHRRTHTGEKPYICQICNHGFAQSNTLKVHMRTHTGERPYICTICNKGQCSSGALLQHMRTHNKI